MPFTFACIALTAAVVTAAHGAPEPLAPPVVRSVTDPYGAGNSAGTLTSDPDPSVRPLTREQAAAEVKREWEERAAMLRAAHKEAWDARAIAIDGRTMKFEFRVFGDPPATGRSLFISMHGGGGAPAEVNEQQWRNQVRLYEPAEGVYLAPRAPTDNWNLWHEAHIDALFDRIILSAVLFENVDPNRVYLTGYSAGGDGVYQLGPRMADRWAACAMMAGHPNEASPLNLRNVPFIINVGGDDAAYNRNSVAAEWGKRLDDLRSADPSGYIHETHVRPGLGHWMKREDASAIPWMMNHTRNPVPDRVVWRQDDVTSSRLYWVGVPDAADRVPGATIIVSRHGQQFTIEQADSVGRFDILLSDDLVNMDDPVTVVCGGRTCFEGRVTRTIAQIERSLDQRADPALIFTGRLEVVLDTDARAAEGTADAPGTP
ncbi:MAG: hypothetical protein AMXMBFR58_17720 [Phycisphaerae bacterium]